MTNELGSVIDEGSLRRFLLGVPPWLTERYSSENGRINLSGWALPPDGQSANWSFLVNGRVPETHKYPMPTPSVERAFPFSPGSNYAGFLLDFETSESDINLGEVEIKFVNRHSRSPAYEFFNQFIDLHSPIVIPDEDQLFRTQGNRSADRYKMHGYTTYKRIQLAIFRHSGRKLEDFRSILDWGCGCGRLTQQLAMRLTQARICGVDIDDENIKWCQANVTRAEFQVVPMSPPTNFAADSFDLIVGISVMTHLEVTSQHAWLHELHRVARPSGYLLLTTHGESALARVKDFNVIERTLSAGSDDRTRDESLNAVIQSETYYRATYHLRNFAHSLFGRYFEVINIIPAGNASMQDIIVLRKPALR